MESRNRGSGCLLAGEGGLSSTDGGSCCFTGEGLLAFWNAGSDCSITGGG